MSLPEFDNGSAMTHENNGGLDSVGGLAMN